MEYVQLVTGCEYIIQYCETTVDKAL